jgi:hypothetical protein
MLPPIVPEYDDQFWTTNDETLANVGEPKGATT